MTGIAQVASEVVKLNYHYEATVQQVFEAWSNPQALSAWFGPHSHTCKIEKFDFREGGEYQLRMVPLIKGENSASHSDKDPICAGQIVQIELQKKIVMTFTWIENGSDIGETLLTIELYPASGGTDLIITHERLPNNEARKAHADGWQGSLECLEEYLDNE